MSVCVRRCLWMSHTLGKPGVLVEWFLKEIWGYLLYFVRKMTEKFIYYIVILCLTMETITFKLQENILKKMDGILRPLNFNTRTEFIREAIRDKFVRHRKKHRSKKGRPKKASDLGFLERKKIFSTKGEPID